MRQLSNTLTRNVFQELCEKVGPREAERLLQDITDSVFEPRGAFARRLEAVVAFLGRTKNALIDAVGRSATKTGSGEAALFSAITGYVSRY